MTSESDDPRPWSEWTWEELERHGYAALALAREKWREQHDAWWKGNGPRPSNIKGPDES